MKNLSVLVNIVKENDIDGNNKIINLARANSKIWATSQISTKLLISS